MSETHFDKVRAYLEEIDVTIVREDAPATLFVVDDESRGINNLIVDCEEEVLVIEQVIFEIRADDGAVFKRLLEMNRELVHGAFVLDTDTGRVLFRDTLQLENLDLNELEGSVNALGLGLATFADELIAFAKGT